MPNKHQVHTVVVIVPAMHAIAHSQTNRETIQVQNVECETEEKAAENQKTQSEMAWRIAHCPDPDKNNKYIRR